MSLNERQGDLLNSDCNVIAHGCNCFHRFGSGIAFQIKNRWPKVWEADSFRTKIGDKEKLGTFTKAMGGNKLVYNLYTQYAYGNNRVYVVYDKLEKALEAMKQDMIDNDIYEKSKIGLPRIGCGLAGGDWNKVKEIIERVFQEKEVFIYVKK